MPAVVTIRSPAAVEFENSFCSLARFICGLIRKKYITPIIPTINTSRQPSSGLGLPPSPPSIKFQLCSFLLVCFLRYQKYHFFCEFYCFFIERVNSVWTLAAELSTFLIQKEFYSLSRTWAWIIMLYKDGFPLVVIISRSFIHSGFAFAIKCYFDFTALIFFKWLGRVVCHRTTAWCFGFVDKDVFAPLIGEGRIRWELLSSFRVPKLWMVSSNARSPDSCSFLPESASLNDLGLCTKVAGSLSFKASSSCDWLSFWLRSECYYKRNK